MPVQAGDDKAAALERVRQSLDLLLPDITPQTISPTAVTGLYEVVFDGRVAYVSADGRYLIQGEIFDLETQQSITQPRLNAVSLAAVEAIGEGRMMVFAPEKIKHTVTLFTDIDSAFSRKIHRELDSYMRLGIKLRYLFFPRAGVGSPSYTKAVTVWCSADPKQALNLAITGQVLEERACPNPVQQHLALGKQLGISGVPALMLENGEMLPGYVAAEGLSEILSRMPGKAAD
jgi:thiol:disulfide interchange protein DsbC